MTTESNEQNQPDPTGDDGKKLAADAIDPQKFTELQSAHDKANKRARELDKELKQIRAELDEKNKKEATDSGDANKIRAEFQKDIDRLTGEKTEVENKFKRAVIESKFNALAPEYFTPDAIKKGVVWKLIKDDVDIAEEDGNVHPVFKNSALPFESALKKFADENPFLAKNPGKPGSGAGGAGSDKKEQGMTRERFHEMSKTEQQAWALKNRDEMNKLLRS